jgi:hypothetical protein
MELRIQAAKHAVATYPKNLPGGASVAPITPEDL